MHNRQTFLEFLKTVDHANMTGAMIQEKKGVLYSSIRGLKCVSEAICQMDVNHRMEVSRQHD